jgi:SAM-dependent methyltransferase
MASNEADRPARDLKQAAELRFWRREIERYREWYTGELPFLYNTPSPRPQQKVRAPNEKDASILTWHKLHQEPKYIENLALPASAFAGMRLLDIAAGPMPSATCFKGCRLFSLEPMLPEYLSIGFPLHYYEGVSFVHGYGEAMPIEDRSFDAVIAVNGIDHVDDIRLVAGEIRRVLKPGGLLRMHMHYHTPNICEPIELNDECFRELFGWCGPLRKIKSSQTSFSADLRGTESFALWGNFQ